MEQMNINADWQVAIDYEHSDVPTAVKELKPVVWKDGDSYCCLFGTDAASGIFGCGDTPIKALLDWDDHLRERIQQADPNDEGVHLQ